MKLLDGKKVASSIFQDLKHKIGKEHSPPGLAVITVGSNPASHVYVQIKKKRCLEVGIAVHEKRFSEKVTEGELIACLKSLNMDRNIHGILIQQPLPSHISVNLILESIDPDKDVDGFHPLNIGRLCLGEERGFIPCTPLGIQQLLLHYEIVLSGKHVVIVGRSNIVGKPLMALLVQKNRFANSTVTLAHSASNNLEMLTRSADILVVAIGVPHLIQPHMIKPGVVVVDVGISRKNGKLVGDVDFERVSPLCSYITPVPGGVGPMTVAMLLSNTYDSFCRLSFS